MTEERSAELEALCQKGSDGWPVMDYDDETPAWYITFVSEAESAMPELLAEVRRLQRTLKVVAHVTGE